MFEWVLNTSMMLLQSQVLWDFSEQLFDLTRFSKHLKDAQNKYEHC